MNTVLSRTRFDTWAGRAVRGVRRRYNDHCITVLTYHSISVQESFLTAGTSLRHHPRLFEEQVDYLAEHYNLISLRDLVAMLGRREQPRRAVVITFDDGYADSLRQAMPILYRRRIPMTLFPVTSVLGNRRLMWQHTLAWLVSHGHTQRVWDGLESGGWLLPGQRGSVEQFARENYRAELPEILDSLLDAVGTNAAALAAKHRPYLEPEDIAEADPDLVTFGNHTDSHPVLSALTVREQRAEIIAAKRRLMDLTRQAPVGFAYPFGLKQHYNEDTKRLVEATGHQAALDTRRRLNVGPVSPFELSRMPAICAGQLEFEKMVEIWPDIEKVPSTGGTGA